MGGPKRSTLETENDIFLFEIKNGKNKKKIYGTEERFYGATE